MVCVPCHQGSICLNAVTAVLRTQSMVKRTGYKFLPKKKRTKLGLP
uniref:Uncharacterized protein LOC105132026 n=1 Tax=Rhizophora mucronata TaxID=61149 RepID=A0A2P2JHM8_RHIMU